MQEDSYKHKGLRKALVKELVKKGIQDERVLSAIEKVPRHFFLDTAFAQHAYEDKPFSIGEGQTISQPFTVAFQTELLAIKPQDRVLEIGTGSGYQSSILLELGANLFTIEVNKRLHEKAKGLLTEMGYQAFFALGDGSKGLPIWGPFDKILVTAGAPYVPVSLVEQLAINGVLVIPVGSQHSQKMIRLTKISTQQLKKEEFGNFRFVKLLGEEGWG